MARHTSPTAVVAFLTALIGVLILPGLLGVVAVVLGITAIEQILSDEELKGYAWAAVAILIGTLTIFLAVVGFALADEWSWSIWNLY